ncbi:MAG: FtsX-like permease family protein [Bauldia sp.]
MNGLALRLALLGSRGSLGRPIGTILGIAVAVALLLLLVGAYLALEIREDRSAWMQPDARWSTPVETLTEASIIVAPVEPVPFDGPPAYEFFDGREIRRLDVAATADTTATIPGIGRPPAPGTYYASPALEALIRSVPRDQLGDRYGTYAGPIGDDALMGPGQLAVVVGHTPEELLQRRDAKILPEIIGRPQNDRVAYQIILAIGAIGLFFPVILFVSIVTQLGAAQRKERLQLLRLIGASRKWVAAVAAAEMFVICAIGCGLGIVLAEIFRPIAAGIQLSGESFFPSDLTLTPGTIALAVLGMIAAATAGAWVTAYQARIASLGPARELRERRPRAWRAIPLLLGLGTLGAAWWFDLALAVPLAIVGAFGLTAIGIVLIGPWLTLHAGEAVRRMVRSASGVIASSRIRSQPASVFRSVSGLILAVFMVSVFAAASSGIMRSVDIADEPGRLPPDALMALLPGDVEDTTLADLDAAAIGATAIGTGRQGGDGRFVIATEDAAAFNLTAPAGATYGSFVLLNYLQANGAADAAGSPRNAAYPTLTAEVRPANGRAIIVARTDGSVAGIERVRSALQHVGIPGLAPMTRAEIAGSGTAELLRELAILAYIGTFISIAIAGCSLAVASVAAMIDRRRILGLLRIMGMPVAAVRRMVAFEAAVPLVSVLVVSIGLGFLVAWLIVDSLAPALGVGIPDPMYFVTVALGVLIAFATIAAGFSLVRRATASEATRFE